MIGGECVVLTVSDTGDGMDEDIQQRIFEPFHTTKDIGKGTGLGLSIVYGIIQQHGAGVNVKSEAEKGTTFTFYFPRISEEVASGPSAEQRFFQHR